MNRQKMIKDILIKMAIDATLPSDMNELDEHIFDPVFFHTLVPNELKDPYLSLEVDIEGHKVRAQVKLDTEGVVLDIYCDDGDEPEDSIWKLYTDMEEGELNVKRD